MRLAAPYPAPPCAPRPMRRMPVLALLISAIILAATLSACFGSDEGKLVCGITLYEPMNYRNADNELVGFDTEFAQMVGKKLDMEVEFQVIEWTQKFQELESGTIDCIWNGLTANSYENGRPRSEYCDFSYSYMLNQQCVVIREDKAGDIKSMEDLADKSIAVEGGSAGEHIADGAIGEGGSILKATSQLDTFREVASGAVDCAVVDILLARSLVGVGNYGNLRIADIEFESEIYAVGFKIGSDLRDKVNKAMKELDEEGLLKELATKYGLENVYVLDTSFTGK